MLICGSSRSSKNKFLADKYVSLINEGISASQILVITLNTYKRNLFFEDVKARINVPFLENPKCFSFGSLVYNTINENYAYIEKTLSSTKSSCPVLMPNLCGLEVSELFWKKALKEAGFKDYNSKINLLHQLFRRYSLITNNNLSEKDVEKRSKILGETFAPDAKKAIELFKKYSTEYRSFDSIRQMNVFKHIYETTNYFEEIKYLFVLDGDEMTRAQFDFISYLKPNLKEFFIAYDKFGTSRMGFSNADLKIVEKIEKKFEDEILTLDSIGFSKIRAEQFFEPRRLKMLESGVLKIKELISQGAKYTDISIVTPVLDSALKFIFKENFGVEKLQFISGSEKLAEDSIINNFISLIKFIVFEENLDSSQLRSILKVLFKIPAKHHLEPLSNYNETRELKIDSPKFSRLTEKLKDKNFSLYDKTLFLCNVFVDETNIDSLEKINFFLKQLSDLEKVFKEEKLNPKFQKIILTQLENSIISENPPNSTEVEDEKLLISTPQKIIDLGIERKYQLWLDVTSNEWVKEDMGTLYNSWVFNASWEKDEFTYEDSVELLKEKTKRQIRKLALLGKEISAFSSLFDINGLENMGGIEEYFESSKKAEKTVFDFLPREDQKPVLDYKSGSMAISAVPGAGKTTILLALIIKLLQNGTKPEHIFVLTYMESAARNFKERIKKILPDIDNLPNISTIHGLALRILKENSNYAKVGLNADFEVCDDNQRQKIIRELIAKKGFEQEDFSKYEKAISALKLSCAYRLNQPKTPEAKKFLSFYKDYNNALKNRNLADYDDMLLYSVKILKNNPEIADWYANICEYVIEDEAQDSSVIQQILLSLLSKKHKNLIRCGDINQSITTTFTNADKEGFSNFIKTADTNVKMTSSQRCTEEVYELANRLIEYSMEKSEFKNSFYPIKMCGVKGKNPVCNNSVNTKIFGDYNEERSYIIEEIRKIFSSDKEASIAILVRNNSQISEYEQFLSSCGLRVITRSDYLDKQPVFMLLFSLLKYIAHPWQNENILEFMTNLNFCGFTSHGNFSQSDFDYIRDLKSPFILQNADFSGSEKLAQLNWDLNYWLENSLLGFEEFILKAGNYYFSSEVEKSNLYLICGLFKKLALQYTTELLERIEEIAKRPSQNKFFEEDDSQSSQKDGTVQIMTFHKSKGDEFDFVFIPGLTENILKFNKNKVKIDSEARFIEHIKSLNPAYKVKNEDELKLLQIEENLRLLYVAITRAKKKLFITCAKKYKYFSRIKEIKPSMVFVDFFINPEKEPSDEK